MKRNIESLQVLRGLAAMLVVLFHLTATLATTTSVDLLGGVFSFGNSGVEIFFVLSGFIISYTATKNIGSGQVRPYLTKRLLRIYPIYWVIISLFVVPAFFLSLHGAYEFTLGNFVSTMMLLPEHQMLNGVSWSLSYELYFYLLFALLIVDRRFVWLVAALLFACLLNFSGVLDIGNSPLGNFLFSQYVLLFFMGVGVYFLFENGKYVPSRTACIIGVTISALAYLIFAQTAHGSPLGTVFYGLMTAIFMFFCVSYENEYPLNAPTSLILLGDASYVLYLFHLPVLNLCIKAIAKMTSTPTVILLLAIGVVAVIVGLSVLLHLKLEKPLNNVLKKRVGSFVGIGTLLSPNESKG